MHLIAKHINPNDPHALLKKFYAYVQNGKIEQTDYNQFAQFNYTRDVNFGKDWDDITKSARGIIFDKITGKIAALPFPKFFNYGESEKAGEHAPPLPNLPFTYTNKFDGSLGIVWYNPWNSKWCVNTRGSFQSEQALWAQKYLDERPYFMEKADTNYTYLFEIIYKENIIVVEYPYEGLVFLTSYHTGTGEEKSDNCLDSFSHAVFAETRKSSLELINEISTMSGSKEGYVLRYSNGYRVKIKGDAYRKIHKLRETCTLSNYIDTWLSSNCCYPTISYDYPEMLQKQLALYQTAVSQYLNTCTSNLAGLWHTANSQNALQNRKMFAAWVFKNAEPGYRPALFMMFDGKSINHIDIVKSLFKHFPTLMMENLRV